MSFIVYFVFEKLKLLTFILVQTQKLNSARALGFEPRSKVLETRMLPLHHARRKQKLS